MNYKEINRLLYNLRSCMFRYEISYKTYNLDCKRQAIITKEVVTTIAHMAYGLSYDIDIVPDKNRIPDIIVKNILYTDNDKSTYQYYGFEHFCIGDMNYKRTDKKETKINSKIFEFYNNTCNFNNKELITNKLVSNRYVLYNKIKFKNANEQVSIVDAFEEKYKHHYEQLPRYIKNMQDKGIEATEENIWFIIESENIIYSNMDESEEVPFILSYDMLKIIDNIGYVEGIIFIGMTEVFAISSEVLKYFFNKHGEAYKIGKMNTTDIYVMDDYIQNKRTYYIAYITFNKVYAKIVKIEDIRNS